MGGFIKKTLLDFTMWTSASGIPHIGRSRNMCMRVFWAVIFLACLGMFIFQTVLLVQTYLERKVMVKTELKFSQMDFPVTTVCNLNPYKQSKINAYPELQSLMAAYDDVIEGRTEGNGSFGLMKVNDSMAQQARARDVLVYLNAQLSEQQQNDLTYEYPEMIQSCTFNGNPCSSENFTLTRDTTYGRCYTYNTTMASQRAGPAFGLRLLLNANESEYLDITESAGFRVTLTTPGEPIFPDAFGYNVAVGSTTSFALKLIRTKRLAAPFGDCTENPSTVYSAEGCFRECLQDVIRGQCACYDPHFNISKAAQKDYCTYDKMDCVNGVTQSGPDGSLFKANECQCPQLCDESVYTVTPTSSNWPSQEYGQLLCGSENRTFDDKTCMEYYRENMLMVQLYFEALNYESFEENEQYPAVQLVSDLGGQIGLWIGVSAITVMEFLLLPCVAMSAMSNQKKSGKKVGFNHDDYDESTNEFDRFCGGHNQNENRAFIPADGKSGMYPNAGHDGWESPPPLYR